MAASFGPSYVRAIAPYIAGKPISEVAREFGLDEASIVKLASNENPLGPDTRLPPRIFEGAATLTPTAFRKEPPPVYDESLTSRVI